MSVTSEQEAIRIMNLGYIKMDEVLQYVQLSDVWQITRANPKVIEQAYKNAQSYLESQLGALYDLDAEFLKIGNQRDSGLVRMFSVLTANEIFGIAKMTNFSLNKIVNKVMLHISDAKQGSFRVLKNNYKDDATLPELISGSGNWT